MKQLKTKLIAMGMALASFSCQNEEAVPNTGNASGRIFLSLPDFQPFVAVGSRAEQALTDLSGYIFTLDGTDGEGNPVSQEITFVENCCIIPAGTYTLTADNHAVAVSGNGTAYYSGTSATFTLSPGGMTQVPSINMGKPKNARIDLNLDETFTALYDLAEVTLSDGDRMVGLTVGQPQGFMMIPENGAVSFTIKAAARKGSHVTDLPAGGLTGHIAIAAGYAYAINLTAKSIEDLMIAIGDGTHDGEFNAKENLENIESLESLESLEFLEPLEPLESLEPLKNLSSPKSSSL